MNNITKTNNQNMIANFLNNEAFKKQLMNVLPKTMTPERMVRIAITEIRMNPRLAECDPMAFAGAIMRCAQIGLEPSSERQLVHLIPFRNNKANRMECQVIIGYRGFLTLASQSNVYIESDVVYENDTFEFQKGLDTKLKFIPCYTGDRGSVIGAYAMARICLPDGTIIFVPEFMPRSDIDKIMKGSKSYHKDDSPWHSHYDSMARKTVIRRLFKYTPLSKEIDSAIAADELADNAQQNNINLVEEIVNHSKDSEIVDESLKPQTQADNLLGMLQKGDKDNEQ